MKSSIKNRGFATLAIAFVVLIVLTLTVLFTAEALINEQKITTNTYRSNLAFDTAQAGIEYGIKYIDTNRATVTDGQTVNGTLLNGSAYQITFNFIGGNKNTANVVSTGITQDGASTRTVKQAIKYYALTGTMPTNPIISRGKVELDGNANVKNLESSTTIISGGAVKIKGSATTELASGVSSNSSATRSDIIENNDAIAGMTDAQLQTNYAGAQLTSFQSSANYQYSGSGTTNYASDVNGKTGSIIYITQSSGTATINGSTTIGSATNPVILVIQGDVKINGNVTIYGNVYSTGNMELSGNLKLNGMALSMQGVQVGIGNTEIYGAIVSGGEYKITGSADLSYDSSILTSNNNALPGNYGRVAGGWQDLNN